MKFYTKSSWSGGNDLGVSSGIRSIHIPWAGAQLQIGEAS